MNDELGDRMKENYENRSRYLLPRRTNVILRVDGKAFHSWTRGLGRPYDESFQAVMDQTMLYLCKSVQGCQLGYVQSDEISLLLTDFDEINTSAWFDGNVQKISSVAASFATGSFNETARRLLPKHTGGLAFFDCRCFVIPDPVEVYNYFLWRQKDCTRNSLQSAAQEQYSHKALDGKGQSDLHEMLFQKGINWNNYPTRFKRGAVCIYNKSETEGKALNKKTGEEVVFTRPVGWEILKDVPIFTSEEGKVLLATIIPRLALEEDKNA
jgi:tRNA(His) 5'-end guanylyltransferase